MPSQNEPLEMFAQCEIEEIKQCANDMVRRLTELSHRLGLASIGDPRGAVAMQLFYREFTAAYGVSVATADAITAQIVNVFEEELQPRWTDS
jgi:hypothetical protein